MEVFMAGGRAVNMYRKNKNGTDIQLDQGGQREEEGTEKLIMTW
jgi:hypothetical protein